MGREREYGECGNSGGRESLKGTRDCRRKCDREGGGEGGSSGQRGE